MCRVIIPAFNSLNSTWPKLWTVLINVFSTSAFASNSTMPGHLCREKLVGLVIRTFSGNMCD